jgi:hypothetical protein
VFLARHYTCAAPANFAPNYCRSASRLAYFLSRKWQKVGWMKREYHRWHSPRLGIDMGVVVYGHWGGPLLGFPTSAGDEWELEGQGMIGSLADFIEAGKVKVLA